MVEMTVLAVCAQVGGLRRYNRHGQALCGLDPASGTHLLTETTTTDCPSEMSRASRLFNNIFHHDSNTPSDSESAAEGEETTPTERDFEPRVGTPRRVRNAVNPKTVPWNAPIRPQDIDKIIRGFQPREMEERWRIYSEDVFDPVGQGRVTGVKVSLIRSWTSFKIFELDVTLSDEVDADGVPVAAWVTNLTYETNKEDVQSENVNRAQREAGDVCRWVLGVDISPEVSEGNGGAI